MCLGQKYVLHHINLMKDLLEDMLLFVLVVIYIYIYIYIYSDRGAIYIKLDLVESEKFSVWIKYTQNHHSRVIT